MRRLQVSVRLDGKRLRALRLQRGMSVEDLAIASGITPRHLWRLEAGERSGVRATTLASLALALGTTVDYLLGLTDEPHRSDGQKGRGKG